MNINDIVLNLVDRLLAEKEENFTLRLEQLQQSQKVENKNQTQD